MARTVVHAYRGPGERPGPGADVDDDGSATDGLGDEVEEPKTGGLDDRRPPALIARREPVVSRDELRHAALPIERLGAAPTSNDTRLHRRTPHEQAIVSTRAVSVYSLVTFAQATMLGAC